MMRPWPPRFAAMSGKSGKGTKSTRRASSNHCGPCTPSAASVALRVNVGILRHWKRLLLAVDQQRDRVPLGIDLLNGRLEIVGQRDHATEPAYHHGSQHATQHVCPPSNESDVCLHNSR